MSEFVCLHDRVSGLGQDAGEQAGGGEEQEGHAQGSRQDSTDLPPDR